MNELNESMINLRTHLRCLPSSAAAAVLNDNYCTGNILVIDSDIPETCQVSSIC